MNDVVRGKIRNRDYAKQLKGFGNLKWGKITPTDIDGFVDFNNRVFVFIECKHGDSSMPYGQKLGLERLCDACESSGMHSIVIVANHNILYTEDIDVAVQPVTLIRHKKQWRKPNTPQTVKSAIDGFVAYANRVMKPEVAQ